MYDVPPLQNTLSLATGETPASLVSRLAAMNRAASAQEFCRDFLISFQGVASGDEEELVKLAHLTSANLEALLAFAPRKISNDVFRLGCEAIPRRIAARQTIRICPACAQRDIGLSPHLGLDAAVAQRAIWLVGCIRTCEEHACSLVTASRSNNPLLIHDFALRSAEALEDIDSLFEQCEARPFSEFERYVAGRIWSEPLATCPLLDALDLKGVALMCTWLGRFIIAGPAGSPRGASESDLYRAAQAGFDVLSKGPEQVRQLLHATHERRDLSNCERPSDDRLLGRFYKFLDLEAGSHPQYEAIRRVFANALCEIYPCSLGVRTVFGIPIERRVLYNLSEAQLTYGLSRKTIKRFARYGGFGRTFNRNGEDVCYAIDVAAADEFFGTSGHVLNGGEVERELGLSRWHLLNLCEKGVISPIGGRFMSGRNAFFRRNDIDKLAADLRARAKLIDRPPKGLVTVGDAAMKTGWSIGAIIEHVLSGKISATIDGDKRLYQALSVDPEELRRLSGEPEGRLLNMREASRFLRIADDALSKLAAFGIIEARDTRRSVTGRWQKNFEASTLEAFQRDFVTLSSVCRKLGGSPQQTLARLELMGAKPAFDPAKIGCRIYRRSEFPELPAT